MAEWMLIYEIDMMRICRKNPIVKRNVIYEREFHVVDIQLTEQLPRNVVRQLIILTVFLILFFTLCQVPLKRSLPTQIKVETRQ